MDIKDSYENRHKLSVHTRRHSLSPNRHNGGGGGDIKKSINRQQSSFRSLGTPSPNASVGAGIPKRLTREYSTKDRDYYERIRQEITTNITESSSRSVSNSKINLKDCCRKFIAFMCTQVGVGGLIVAYAIVGAFTFISIETQIENPTVEHISKLRNICAKQLWDKTEENNLFNSTIWKYETDLVLKEFQKNISIIIKNGNDWRLVKDVWTFPAALMFCLSVFTMIGYGNMYPRTQWGKGMTVIYATFGIPLYVLYFLNMGKVLAKTFKFLYRLLHECSHSHKNNDNGKLEIEKRPIIVPSTACLWVITFYILTGTIMFANWESWSYLDSVYFCVTSLCKIGIGDFVPGTNILEYSTEGKQTKLAINFVYMLLGMGLVAMCYNLMREEVKVKMKEIKEDLKICLEDVRTRFAGCCNRNDDYNDEYYV